MTIEEYTERLQKAVLKADEAPVLVQEVIENLKTDLTSLESFRTQNAEYAETIKGLRETNIKLFMSTPGVKGITDQGPDDKQSDEDPMDHPGIEGANLYLAQNGLEGKLTFQEKFSQPE